MVNVPFKPVGFVGDSLAQIRRFPEGVRKAAGVERHKVQQGIEPTDWKPMSNIGPGVREIRLRDEVGAYRVIYIARIATKIYVLHAFQEKTEKTSKHDLELAMLRLKQIGL